MNFAGTLGIDLDILLMIVLGLAVLVIVLLILTLVNMSRLKKEKARLKVFLTGKDGASLEDTLIHRLDQIDELIRYNKYNEENIQRLMDNNQFVFQKMGLEKYDAFNEMGGKLSFSVCLLDNRDNGFILNAMHTREGCYTYIKEIIDGNSIVVLSAEEQKALDAALGG